MTESTLRLSELATFVNNWENCQPPNLSKKKRLQKGGKSEEGAPRHIQHIQRCPGNYNCSCSCDRSDILHVQDETRRSAHALRWTWELLSVCTPNICLICIQTVWPMSQCVTTMTQLTIFIQTNCYNLALQFACVTTFKKKIHFFKIRVTWSDARTRMSVLHSTELLALLITVTPEWIPCDNSCKLWHYTKSNSLKLNRT